MSKEALKLLDTSELISFIVAFCLLITVVGYCVYDIALNNTYDCGYVKAACSCNSFHCRVGLTDGRKVNVSSLAISGDRVCWKTKK